MRTYSRNTLTGAVYFGFYRGARTQIPEAPGLKTTSRLGQTASLRQPEREPGAIPRRARTILGTSKSSPVARSRRTRPRLISHAQIVKLLHTHTLAMGFDLERTRIDMDDYSYTPGDNTVQRRAHAGARRRNSSSRIHQERQRLCRFLHRLRIQLLPGQRTQGVSARVSSGSLCCRTTGR